MIDMAIPEYNHDHKAQFEKLEVNQDQLDAMRYGNYNPEDGQLFKLDMSGEASQEIHSCKGNESEYHTEAKMKHCEEGPGLWVVRCHACNKPFIIQAYGVTCWTSPDLIKPEPSPAKEFTRRDMIDFADFLVNCQRGDLTIEEYFNNWQKVPRLHELEPFAESDCKSIGEFRNRLTESEALSFAAWYSDRCNEGSDYAGELTIEAWRAGQ